MSLSPPPAGHWAALGLRFGVRARSGRNVSPEYRGHALINHLGYWTDDLAATSVALEERGCPKVLCAWANDQMFGMAYHQMPDGMYVEIVDRSSFADWPAFLSGRMEHAIILPD